MGRISGVDTQESRESSPDFGRSPGVSVGEGPGGKGGQQSTKSTPSIQPPTEPPAPAETSQGPPQAPIERVAQKGIRLSQEEKDQAVRGVLEETPNEGAQGEQLRIPSPYRT